MRIGRGRSPVSPAIGALLLVAMLALFVWSRFRSSSPSAPTRLADGAVPVGTIHAEPPPPDWVPVEIGPLTLRLPPALTRTAEPRKGMPGVLFTTPDLTVIACIPTQESGTAHLARLRSRHVNTSWDEVDFRAYLYGTDEESIAALPAEAADELLPMRRLIVSSLVKRVEVFRGEGLKGLCLYLSSTGTHSISFEYYSNDERCRGVVQVYLPKHGDIDSARRIIASCRFRLTEDSAREIAQSQALASGIVAKLRPVASSLPTNAPE